MDIYTKAFKCNLRKKSFSITLKNKKSGFCENIDKLKLNKSTNILAI